MKGIALKGESKLVSMLCVHPLSKDTIFMACEQGGFKHMRISDVPVTNRAVKGVQIYKPVKSNPQSFMGAYLCKKEHYLQLFNQNDEIMKVEYKELPTQGLDTRLTTTNKQKITFVYNSFFNKEEDMEIVQVLDEPEVHFETLSLDDFLN